MINSVSCAVSPTYQTDHSENWTSGLSFHYGTGGGMNDPQDDVVN